MNGITELAKLLKERENSDGYSPMFGTVIELPNTKNTHKRQGYSDRQPLNALHKFERAKCGR